MTFSLEDIHKTKTILGNGSYSSVVLGDLNGSEVALKVFSSNDKTVMELAKNEASICNMIGKHPNVICYYGNYVENEGTPVIVMEKAEKPLVKLFREERLNRTSLTYTVLKNRALQVCRGLKYLHDLNISHGDISIKNIVVASDGTLKICDLGFAVVLKNRSCYDASHRCTLSSAAPEYLLTWQRTLSTDIYSLGIVLLELALRDNAYSTHFLQKYESDRGFDSFAFANDVINGMRPTIPDAIPTEYANIIRACLVDESSHYRKRPSIDEVITLLNNWVF